MTAWLWRILPFVGRMVHQLEVGSRDAQIAALTAERDYWRQRAERLMDAALARAGAIHEPTMVDRPVVSGAKDPAALIAGALAISEFDSTLQKRKGNS